RNQPARSSSLDRSGSLRWFVRERNLQMAGFVDLDDQGHAAFRTAQGKCFARVFVCYEIGGFQVRVGTVFDDTTTELSLVIWIIEIDDRDRYPRIATCVLCL